MAKGKAPAYQIYPSDDFSDGRLLNLSPLAYGVYGWMRHREWLDGSLPNSAVAVAALMPRGIKLEDVETAWPDVQPLFEQHDGRLIHQANQAQREEHAKWREKCAKGGKESARVRRANGSSRLVEPDLKRSSNTVEDLCTSNSDLQTPNSDLQTPKARSRARDGAMAGMLPREHLSHIACDATFSRCVPVAVHRKLANLLAPKHGGDREAASKVLLAWYPTVWKSLPADAVLGDAFAFWQPRFDAAFATPIKRTPRQQQPLSQRVPSAEETQAMLDELRNFDPTKRPTLKVVNE